MKLRATFVCQLVPLELPDSVRGRGPCASLDPGRHQNNARHKWAVLANLALWLGFRLWVDMIEGTALKEEREGNRQPET